MGLDFKHLNKGQKRLVFLLIVVIAYAAFDLISNWDEYSGVYSGQGSAADSLQAVDSIPAGVDSAVTQRRDTRFVYTKGWATNPFTDRTKPPPSANKEIKLYLKGISMDGNNSVAIINGRVVKAGEIIAGYRIIKIKPGKVLLKKNNKLKTLILK